MDLDELNEEVTLLVSGNLTQEDQEAEWFAREEFSQEFPGLERGSVRASDAQACFFEYVFPLDQYGRLGGMYSTADLPVCKITRMRREGILECVRFPWEGNARHILPHQPSHFFVRDVEKGFRRWVSREHFHSSSAVLEERAHVREALLKNQPDLWADGWSIRDPQDFIDLGFDSASVWKLNYQHESGTGHKSTIYDESGDPMEYCEGVRTLDFLSWVCQVLDPTFHPNVTGRGAKAKLYLERALEVARAENES